MAEKKTPMKQFITDFLDQEGCDWREQDGRIVISDEFQTEKHDPELGFGVPYFLTEYNYPCSLNKRLSEFNDRLDHEYGRIFECDWSGTFSVSVKN